MKFVQMNENEIVGKSVKGGSDEKHIGKTTSPEETEAEGQMNKSNFQIIRSRI